MGYHGGGIIKSARQGADEALFQGCQIVIDPKKEPSIVTVNFFRFVGMNVYIMGGDYYTQVLLAINFSAN